jgi:hypothetical protein
LLVATESEIAYVRDLIGEPDDSNGWSDERIGTIIDGSTSLRLAASDIWGVKASKFTKMVDITESGSSRKMSQLFSNALAMQKALREDEETEDPVDPLADRPRTRAIIRP